MHSLFGFQFDKPLKRLDTGVLKGEGTIPNYTSQFNWRGVIFLFRKTDFTT